MKRHLVRQILVSLPVAIALFFVGVMYPQPGEAMRRTATWLTDIAGPQIEAGLPQEYIGGILPIRVSLIDESEAEVIAIAIDGKPLADVDAAQVDTGQLADGDHVLTVESADRSLRQNTSRSSFSFRTDNTPPKVTAQTEPSQAGQGRTLMIKLSPSEPVTMTGSLGGQSLVFLRSGDYYWTVVGFAPDSKVGAANLELAAVDRAGLEAKVQVPISVVRIDYPTETLYIPEDRSVLLSPTIVNAENDYLAKVFAIATAEKLWSGSFLIPARAEISSPFAIRRSYNGGPFGSHHGGMDIAAMEKTPAAAANRGRVVVAEPLQVRGNAVILDHGMQVYSAYYHLSEIRVQKGQMVEPGQIVGLVGNTGLSTGPHLHWEMRVSGAPVDPLEWTTRTIP